MFKGHQLAKVALAQKLVVVAISLLEDLPQGRLKLVTAKIGAGCNELGPIHYAVAVQIHRFSRLFRATGLDTQTLQEAVHLGRVQSAMARDAEFLEGPLDRGQLVRRPGACNGQGDALVKHAPLRHLGQTSHDLLRHAGCSGPGASAGHLAGPCLVHAIQAILQEGRPEALGSRRPADSVEEHHQPAQLIGTRRGRLQQLPIDRRGGLPKAGTLETVARHREGQPEAQQLEQDHPAAEDISLRCEDTAPDLRRHRGRGPHGLVVRKVARVEELRHPKVDQHHVRALIVLLQRVRRIGGDRHQSSLVGHEHDVRRLYVEVDDTARMHVRGRHQDLLHGICHETLWETPATLAPLQDRLLQLPPGAEVRD
mmetsp:Transcript_119068/g.384463  ORF Transcript_119068/g.384463 Transcript_119068/m.384463 type:complete len:368 (-) Transcript_119068:552-1655(-)